MTALDRSARTQQFPQDLRALQSQLAQFLELPTRDDQGFRRAVRRLLPQCPEIALLLCVALAGVVLATAVARFGRRFGRKPKSAPDRFDARQQVARPTPLRLAFSEPAFPGVGLAPTVIRARTGRPGEVHAVLARTDVAVGAGLAPTGGVGGFVGHRALLRGLVCSLIFQATRPLLPMRTETMHASEQQRHEGIPGDKRELARLPGMRKSRASTRASLAPRVCAPAGEARSRADCRRCGCRRR